MKGVDIYIYISLSRLPGISKSRLPLSSSSVSLVCTIRFGFVVVHVVFSCLFHILFHLVSAGPKELKKPCYRADVLNAMNSSRSEENGLWSLSEMWIQLLQADMRSSQAGFVPRTSLVWWGFPWLSNLSMACL